MPGEQASLTSTCSASIGKHPPVPSFEVLTVVGSKIARRSHVGPAVADLHTKQDGQDRLSCESAPSMEPPSRAPLANLVSL